MAPLTTTQSVIAAIVSAFILYVSYLYFAFKRAVSKRSGELAKSSEPKFPLGNLIEWHDLLKANKDILQGFEMSDSKLPVAQWTFTSESLAVVHHTHVEQILRSSVSRVISPAILNSMGIFHIIRFMGKNSVGVLEGERWSEVRKSIGKSLRNTYIKGLHQSIDEITSEAVVWIENQCELGEPIDMSPILHAITIDVVSMAVFKYRLGALTSVINNKQDPLVEAFRFASSEMARRTSSLNPLDWMYFLGRVRRSQRRLDHAHRVIREGIEHIIKERLRQGIREEDEDLLIHMGCTSVEKITPEIVDNVITMMWAGHDTTAASLSFCLHLLSVNPSVQDHLRTQLLESVHNTSEMIHKVRYLDSVCKETLRMHPPALWTNRGITCPIKLSAGEKVVDLPVGSTVFIPIWAVHHSKANWGENAHIFNPERFLEETHPQYAFIPFGGGNRVCPGQNLAPFEFKCVLSFLIKRFRFSPVKLESGEIHRPTIQAYGMFQDCTNNLLLIEKV